MPKLRHWGRFLCVFLILTLIFPFLSSCISGKDIPSASNTQISVKEIDVLSHAAFDVSAKAAIGIEISSGEIFYSKNIDQRLPMASTTKIMTAIIAIENGKTSDRVRIHRDAVGIEGSSIYLYENEVLTLEELLYAILLESANDAATAIAIHIAGNEEKFVSLMNEKASELGLIDTHFDNPHGLDGETHYTTAKELAIIAAYAMRNPTFRRIVSTYKTTVPMSNGEGTRVLINHNKLLRNYDGAIGIKTGFTKKSGRCLVSASSRNGVELVCVTLSAPSDWQDHESILDLGNSLYEHKVLATKGEISLSLPVICDTQAEIPVTNAFDISVTLRQGERLTRVIEAPRFLFAPVRSGDTVGRVIYIQNGEIVASSPLIAAGTVEAPKKSGIFDLIRKLLKLE